MTHEEFHRDIRNVFRRSPLVPAVIELTGGDRVVVDMPEQLEAGPAAITIRRRTDHLRPRIGYEEIGRVIPLDELPAERGSLSYAEFYATVRPLLWRQPFQPFSLEFRDGTKLVVDSPGRLALAGRFGVFLPPDPTPLVRFTYDQVARVTTSDMARAG